MPLRFLRLTALLVMTIGLGSSSAVHAETLLFKNDPRLTSDLGFFSDLKPPGNNPRQIQADDFQLNHPSRITKVRWWGRYFEQGQAGAITEEGSDRFRLEFFEDDGERPGLAPVIAFDLGAASRTQVGTSSNGVPLFEFESYLVEPLTLLGSRTYYLSLYNASEQDDRPVFSLLWSTPLDFANQPRWFRSNFDQPWTQSGFNTAFALYGQVIPEPSSLGMIGLGLGMVVMVIRRGGLAPGRRPF